MIRGLLLTAVLLLTACGGSDTAAPTSAAPPPVSPAPVEPAPAGPVDPVQPPPETPPDPVEPPPETPPPVSQPPLPAGAMSEQQAARLLQQATFGPTMADINYATGLTVQQWIDKQLALPATLHMPNVPDVIDKSHPSHYTRVEAWLQIALDGPDQLRQRVAFALSEILVTSMHHPNLDTEPLELANYYDILVRNAFGNYRELLEEVAKSPVMGVYLSHMSNEKPDPARNIRSDENFAREVLQLFTIGLVQLNEDGTENVIDGKQRLTAIY